MADSQVTWDLTELFPNITDPSVEKAFNEARASADAFEAKYRGKIPTLTPKTSTIACGNSKPSKPNWKTSDYTQASFSRQT